MTDQEDRGSDLCLSYRSDVCSDDPAFMRSDLDSAFITLARSEDEPRSGVLDRRRLDRAVLVKARLDEGEGVISTGSDLTTSMGTTPAGAWGLSVGGPSTIPLSSTSCLAENQEIYSGK